MNFALITDTSACVSTKNVCSLFDKLVFKMTNSEKFRLNVKI